MCIVIIYVYSKKLIKLISLFSGYDEATSRCEEEDYSLLDHLTPGSTKFVTSKVDQDRTGSKSLMIWLGTQRQRTSNFRGEEWRWQSSKQKVASLDWAKGQPNNYNQARCSNFKKYSHQISVPLWFHGFFVPSENIYLFFTVLQ